MTLPISGIPGIGAAVGVGGVAGIDTNATAAANGDAFSNVLAATFDQLRATQAHADGLAAQAATGDLKDVHDYMIARNESSLAVEMVVGIKNKAVEAFNEIMRMPI